MVTPTRATGVPVAKVVAVAKVTAVVVVAWAWLLLPHLGGLGEMAAIAAPALFLGVLVLHAMTLLVWRRLIVGISMLAWFVSGTVMILSPRTPTHFSAPRHPVVLVAANIRFDNSSPDQSARDVIARHADVAVVSEGTRETESVLAPAYPYFERSRYHGNNYFEFVGSRYPLRVMAVPPELPQAVVVEVMAPEPFVLVAVHLPKPGLDIPKLRGKVSFAGQRRAVDAVTRLTNSTSLPVVVAGDFNASDRTAAYRRIVAHRRDALRATWAGSTYRAFPWNLLALRIDHVIIDHTWCAAHARRFHPTGSDHLAVEATIGPC